VSLSDLAVRAASLAQRFQRIRSRTLGLCVGFSAEDMMVQSMPDASPAKWHLAHTTWFFEQFLLGRDPAWRPRHPEWHYLFNSYYQTVGPMHARPRRGLLSRPSLDEVLDYRRRIEEAVAARLHAGLDEAGEAIVELGLQHEQQHQELLLTDIQHALWCHPLHPAYDEAFDGFAPAALRGNPKARQEWAVQHLKWAASASKNLGIKAHATFSGSLAWPFIYPFPQRPAGLVTTAPDWLRAVGRIPDPFLAKPAAAAG